MKTTTKPTTISEALASLAPNALLCDLPDDAFCFGGAIDDACRIGGYDQSGRVTINHLNAWRMTVAELADTLAPTTPTASNYEIVFDNAGGATLQTHDGQIAINYSDMRQLAADALAINNGETAEGWDGIDPNHYISDEEYEKHASTGGYFAIQLHPELRHNWPDPEETGWKNVAAFLRHFSPPTP